MAGSRTFHFGKCPVLRIPFANWKVLLKWVLIIGAYSFLVYKLLTFDQYAAFLSHWKQMPQSHLWWLVGVLLLLPVNLLLESTKWKLLVSKVEEIDLKNAFKAILSGISAGFLTPNRVGDVVGRMMYLLPENRKAAFTLSIVSAMTQNIIMILCGVPACVLFFTSTGGKMEAATSRYVIVLSVCLLSFVFIYFAFPRISRLMEKNRHYEKIKAFTDCLSYFSKMDLLQIVFIALIRYLVFSVQFFFMLGFFGIELTGWQALIAIPTNYLLVTFTPSFAFSDVAVRSSYAVFVIGAFSVQLAGIALAGVCIWVINFVIPMLVGSVMLAKSK